jgi:DNA-directed RNA polymerase subunit M/transcription elongation factor TFIIS
LYSPFFFISKKKPQWLPTVAHTPQKKKMFTNCSRDYNQSLTQLTSGNYELQQKMAFNLQLNGDFLTQRYTPAEIVTLNDDMLAESSEVEKEKTMLMECYQAYESLLSADFLQGLGAVDCITCRFCGKGNVEYTTKQTRSADEGSTIFLMCTNSNCKKRWKM